MSGAVGHTLVQVTQDDRKAAAARLSRELAEGTISMLLEGRMDGHPWAQAFARHRIASTDELREALERIKSGRSLVTECELIGSAILTKTRGDV